MRGKSGAVALQVIFDKGSPPHITNNQGNSTICVDENMVLYGWGASASRMSDAKDETIKGEKRKSKKRPAVIWNFCKRLRQHQVDEAQVRGMAQKRNDDDETTRGQDVRPHAARMDRRNSVSQMITAAKRLFSDGSMASKSSALNSIHFNPYHVS